MSREIHGSHENHGARGSHGPRESYIGRFKSTLSSYNLMVKKQKTPPRQSPRHKTSATKLSNRKSAGKQDAREPVELHWSTKKVSTDDRCLIGRYFESVQWNIGYIEEVKLTATDHTQKILKAAGEVEPRFNFESLP